MLSTITSTKATPVVNLKAAQSTVTQILPIDDESKTGPSTEQCLETESRYCMEGMASHPIVMERGQGSLLWDIDGKRYIDFNAGMGSCNQGHCHPKIAQAMIEQCQTLTMPSRNVHVQQCGEFCRKICEITGFDKVGLGSSGAEAVDLAVKVARAWGYKVKGIEEDKALVLAVTSNYHGRTLSVLSGSTNEAYRANCGPWMPNIGPYCAGNEVRFNVIEDLEKAFQIRGHEIAGFMIEAIQGQNGCQPASNEYLLQVRELCNRYNVLFICDEIQSGLGRSGEWFSYQASGVKPDMVVLGKSLSGGLFPISGVSGKKEAMDCLTGDQYGSTFAGNPLACAVGIAALDVIIEEDLPARAAHLGEAFTQRCSAIKSPHFDGVSGRGLFRSMWINENHPQGRITAQKVAKLCVQRGLLVNASGRRLRTCPALNIDEDLMIQGLDIIEKALVDLEEMDFE
ncbi:hypothetical protein V2G26_002349 [Clonostachys chloroleuca]|uniref:Ornithine aminotransferase n=1 Tax=Clonostachys chloroleuca TaxID=1926264 RepID=A0AA35LPP4_9HYPO|nr:unnamed protein product [Clonostachys chloroleuca]